VKIEVRVSTNSKISEIVLSDGLYKARLKSKPTDNLANKELISLVASYFKVSKSYVRILKGLKSRSKLIEIEQE